MVRNFWQRNPMEKRSLDSAPEGTIKVILPRRSDHSISEVTRKTLMGQDILD